MLIDPETDDPTKNPQPKTTQLNPNQDLVTYPTRQNEIRQMLEKNPETLHPYYKPTLKPDNRKEAPDPQCYDPCRNQTSVAS